MLILRILIALFAGIGLVTTAIVAALACLCWMVVAQVQQRRALLDVEEVIGG